MQKSNIIITTLTAVAVILVSGLFLSGRWQTAAPVYAQNDSGSAAQRYITVVGEGVVNIKPDIAKTTIGVETIKATVKEASDENQQTISQVLEALKAAGVADDDIQTAGFNIFTEQFFPPESGPQSEPQYRYHVTNQVQVTIRDIDKVGDVLDAAIEAGANSTYGVEFQLEDQEAAQSDARALAIESANAKAAELAKLTNVSVGQVLSVSEVIGNSPYFSAPSAQAYGMGGGGGGTPISAGELQLTMQVQVTYALE
ncbi:MAG: SIMPL domain-containing protein [Caldilineaceae bacterium]|nr:SIMPL domain-containing protein [Caldilineaceae bacterium]